MAARFRMKGNAGSASVKELLDKRIDRLYHQVHINSGHPIGPL